MKMLARMYTESVRTVLDLEIATLKRCEWDEEGVEMAVQG